MKRVVFCLLSLITFSAAEAQQMEEEKPVPVLDHIAFYVKNADSTAAFYEKFFRLESVNQPFKNAPVRWFKISPGVLLHFIGGAKKNVEVSELSHLCFSVKSLNGFIETLKQNGTPFNDSNGHESTIQHRPDGVNQIFFQDPNGYWIEVNDAVH